ncbi:hypothetical protein FTX61_02810 [Nitriliruptoraceae bacterium ZYF776]|nr:hypothetical protein [Profundirhabdus halotolerans]
MGQDVEAVPVRVRWAGRATAALLVGAVAAGALTLAGAATALSGWPVVVVALLGGLPPLAAWLLHRRLRWLLLAGPDVVAELRALADRGGTRPAAADLRRRAEALRDQLAGSRRRSLWMLWRTVRVLRAPAAEGLQLAQDQLGAPNASLATTVRAVERSAGLAALAWVAVLGTFVAGVAGAVLLVAGAF